MKHFIYRALKAAVLALLPACLPGIAPAQLMPFTNVGAKWYYIRYPDTSQGSDSTVIRVFTCIKDTVIFSQPFSVIEAPPLTPGFTTYSYMAKDTAHGVYFYDYNHAGDTSGHKIDTIYKAFDFTLKKGDSGIFFANFTHSGDISVYQAAVKVTSLWKQPSSSDSVVALEVYGASLPPFAGSAGGFCRLSEKYFNTSMIDDRHSLKIFGAFNAVSYVYPEIGAFRLSCFEDSSGITKFVFFNNGCDYVGIHENVQTHSGLRIFPNPSAGEVFISGINSTLPLEVQLLDALGRQVSAAVIRENESISLKGLPAAAYLVIVHLADGRTLREHVVVHD